MMNNNDNNSNNKSCSFEKNINSLPILHKKNTSLSEDIGTNFAVIYNRQELEMNVE